MKVRAAVLRALGLPMPYAASQPLVIEEVELQPPGVGELLVRMLAAGLCHSDLSVINGSRPRVLPMALGHEACAEVVELGRDTRGFAVGDRVVLAFVPSCGRCVPCASGRAALCEPGAASNLAGSLLGGDRRLQSGDGSVIHHHLGVSAFAEYAVISAASAVKIDSDLSPAIAALFGCAVLTGVGAALNTAQLRAGDSVAIFGLGGIGMAALLGASVSGAHPLIGVDPVAQKRATALSLGATHVVAGNVATALEEIRDLSGGGVQVSIECVGDAEVLKLAYAATRRGGTTISAGLPDPAQQFSISAVSLVAEERTIRGSYMGSAVPARDIPRYIALHRAGRLPVDALLSERLSLGQINHGFDRLARGETLRQVIDFVGSGHEGIVSGAGSKP